MVMFVLLATLSFVCINAFESSCEQGNVFELTDLSLQYYPPDGLDYSMVRVYGIFPQDTYVSQVQVSWSPDNNNWNSYPSLINATYVAWQYVQFAPWYILNEIPEEGEYFYGQFLIQGSTFQNLSCIAFTIPMVPSIPL
ncbi:hypothetical protein SteCoe_30581 [Stentor coeruleus]|uniref:F5/8 type C domain-containing protein n=1 Tax=Stentor coeruleus TaxID=5963 RepID=A0A1R2B3C7_9CILI|nr:hypothetical protein SteCoe_30581 [Stentor coeruleus]